jgi:hypothetical protein
MVVRVIYSSEAFLHRSGGNPGQQSELFFASADAAKETSLPEGHAFAFIPVENGYHAYSPRLGWEFCSAL